jgi:hypothetical protein
LTSAPTARAGRTAPPESQPEVTVARPCWSTTCGKRQPALDYTSLDSLASFLGNLFWSDIEQHHPGIASIHLSAETATAWKQRLQTVSWTTRTPAGETVTTSVPRINYRAAARPASPGPHLRAAALRHGGRARGGSPRSPRTIVHRRRSGPDPADPQARDRQDLGTGTSRGQTPRPRHTCAHAFGTPCIHEHSCFSELTV